MNVKLTGEQRAVIVENDPVAQRNLIQLWEQVKSGKITPAKAKRLNEHIEGWAIERWRVSCLQRGVPLSAAASRLTQPLDPTICKESCEQSTSPKVETKQGFPTESCQ